MTQTGFPVDLILFAMIAAFLVLRLRSILGKRTGFEGTPPRPVRGPVAGGRAEPTPANVTRNLPDPASELGATLAEIGRVDRRFSPRDFLAGAEKAFRLIVAAFAAGDRDRLRPLLTAETLASFEAVIAARETAGETQRTEIRDMVEASIAAATLAGQSAMITVRFVSRQVNVTLGRDGQPIAGADALTELVDVWDFARELTARENTWRLAAARSA